MRVRPGLIALAAAGLTSSATAAPAVDVDLFEYRLDGDHSLFVDSTATAGPLVAKLSAGGSLDRRIDQVDAQLLYSRRLGGGFALLGGIRHIFRPSPHRSYATIGVEGEIAAGLAVESWLHLSEKGELLGEGKMIYDLRVHRRWVLQPRASFHWAAQRVGAQQLAAGITDSELGLRLGYEIGARFKPYVGVSHERRLGASARLARQAGERTQETYFVAGFSAGF